MSIFPVVVFPDAQDIVIGYLVDRLPDFDSTVGVYEKVPAPRPTAFVLVRRAGGERATVVTDFSLLTVEAWASKDEDASDLIQLVRGLLHAMPGTVDTTVCYLVQEAGGPVNLPDPESDQARFTMTIQIALRGLQVEPSGT